MRTHQRKFVAKTLVAIICILAISGMNAKTVFALAATSMKDTLTREKAATSSAHVVSMTLPAGGISTGGLLTVTYPGSFSTLTTTPDVVCGAGTATASLATTVLTLTGGATPCTGTLVVGGVTPFTSTNPAAGTYTVTLAGSAGITGTFAVVIVSEDQVSITASVDPSITFNVGANLGCSGAFSGNGGTVALGAITTGAVATSNGTTVNNICTRVTTNAGSGAAVTVRSLNAALTSTSTPAHTIASATATLAGGTNGYGLCAGSTSDSGRDSTTPAGSVPAASSPFSSTCTNTGHQVGQLTTGTQTVWTIAGPSQNAYFNLYVKAAISGTQPAHTDYADTLTFIATATF